MLGGGWQNPTDIQFDIGNQIKCNLLNTKLSIVNTEGFLVLADQYKWETSRDA